MTREYEYCCLEFEDSVKEGKFIHSKNYDETEWFMPEWLHIYYCPFCGSFIKGNGFGEPSQKCPPNQSNV